MVAAPTPVSRTNGLIVTDTIWNADVTAMADFMLGTGRPFFKAIQTVVQSIPNNAFTPITFTTEQIDNMNGHSTSVNTSRYTCQMDGWYDLRGRIAFGSPPYTNNRGAQFTLNGAVLRSTGVFHAPAPDNDTVVNTDSYEFLQVGDYVELRGYHITGAALPTTIVGTTLASTFSAKWDRK